MVTFQYECNLSTKEEKEKKDPWFQVEDEDKTWKKSSQKEKKKKKKKIDSIVKILLCFPKNIG